MSTEHKTFEERLEKFLKSASSLWDEWMTSQLPQVNVSNGFVCSMFLLVGLEMTIFVSSQIDGRFVSAPIIGHDLSGTLFGVVLAVSTQFSMMLGSRIIRYPLNDLQHIIGFGLGNVLFALFSLPTVIIAPELYTLLIIEIFVSMMFLVVRLTVSIMPQVQK